MTLFFIIIFALLFGSFASCVSYRLANSQNFIFTRSKCVKCNEILQIKNLIPIFSYLFQKGKCKKCGQKISPRYLLIEILFVAIFVGIFVANNFIINQNFFLLCLIALILAIISIIDIENYFIPDLMQISLFLLSLIFIILEKNINYIPTALIHGFLYAFFGISLLLLFYFSANILAIGVDDIKLLFIIGFILGIGKFLPFIFLTGIFGVIFGLLWGFFKKDETFPFAPVLCLAMFICLILKEKFNFMKIINSIIM